MDSDSISSALNIVAEAAGGLWAIGRLVLLVSDAMDDRWPWLRPLTNVLGRFLGGAKARY